MALRRNTFKRKAKPELKDKVHVPDGGVDGADGFGVRRGLMVRCGPYLSPTWGLMARRWGKVTDIYTWGDDPRVLVDTLPHGYVFIAEDTSRSNKQYETYLTGLTKKVRLHIEGDTEL